MYICYIYIYICVNMCRYVYIYIYIIEYSLYYIGLELTNTFEFVPRDAAPTRDNGAASPPLVSNVSEPKTLSYDFWVIAQEQTKPTSIKSQKRRGLTWMIFKSGRHIQRRFKTYIYSYKIFIFYCIRTYILYGPTVAPGNHSPKGSQKE